MQEAQAFGGLLLAATDGIKQAHLAAVAAATCGTWLVDNRRGHDRDMLEPLVRAATRAQLPDAALALSLPLVGRHPAA